MMDILQCVGSPGYEDIVPQLSCTADILLGIHAGEKPDHNDLSLVSNVNTHFKISQF